MCVMNATNLDTTKVHVPEIFLVQWWEWWQEQWLAVQWQEVVVWVHHLDMCVIHVTNPTITKVHVQEIFILV
jgi:hypothetical protein